MLYLLSLSLRLTRKKLSALLALSFFSILVVAENAVGESAVGGYLDVEGYSEPVPIVQMMDGWQQSGVGEGAQAKARVGLGVATYVPIANWFGLTEYGVEKRWDYHLSFSKDTARFYSRLEAEDLPAGVYPLRLSVNAVEARALYVQFRHVFAGLTLSARLNLLQASAMQYGDLRGEGIVREDGSYSFEYDLDYHYSRNLLLEKSVSGESGYGHSLDLKAEYLFDSDLRASVEIADALYEIYWQDIGHSDGCLYRQKTDLNVCDQNFVQDSKVDLNQVLPMDARFELQYKQANVGLRKWGREYFADVGWSWYLAGHTLAIQYDLLHQSIVAAWSKSEFKQLSLGLNSLEPNEAKYWSLNMKYFWN